MDDDELHELAATVRQLKADIEQDRAMQQELAIAVASGRPPHEADHAYGDWRSWVEDWLLPRISRSPHRHRWCHRYAEHLEIAERLEALWHAWESAWPEPTARMAWFRDGLDHQWSVISAEDGPLRSCSALEGVHVDDIPVATGGLDDAGR